MTLNLLDFATDQKVNTTTLKKHYQTSLSLNVSPVLGAYSNLFKINSSLIFIPLIQLCTTQHTHEDFDVFSADKLPESDTLVAADVLYRIGQTNWLEGLQSNITCSSQ